MSFVKLQSARFLNWVQEKNAADSVESLISQFDALYESFASEYNVAGSVVDSLVQIAVEKPKTSSSGISELTMNEDQIVLTNVDGVLEPVAKKPRAPKKPKAIEEATESVTKEPQTKKPRASKKPKVQEPVVQEQSVQEQSVQEPVVQEQSVQEPLEPAVLVTKPKKPRAPKKPKTVQEPVVQEQSVQEQSVQEPVVQEPVVQEQSVQEQSVQEQSVQEQSVQEPLEPAVQESAVLVTKPKKPRATKKDKDEDTTDDASAKKKRTYSKKPKVVEDTEANVVVVTPELVEEPMVEQHKPVEEPEDALELEEICIDDQTFYVDTKDNLYNTEFVQVGILQNSTALFGAVNK
jgi:hypothetical protein